MWFVRRPPRIPLGSLRRFVDQPGDRGRVPIAVHELVRQPQPLNILQLGLKEHAHPHSNQLKTNKIQIENVYSSKHFQVYDSVHTEPYKLWKAENHLKNQQKN
jgi:hypothetical protein